MFDITSIKEVYSNGFGKFLFVLLVALFTVFAEKMVRKGLNNYFKKASKIIKVDVTQFTVFKHFMSALIYVIGFGAAIYAIPSLKTLSVSLFAGAGVLAIIVGFASQKAFSNIIAGIFIAIFKPFRVGDIIKFGDKIGVVEDITLRHTVVRNFENRRYIIPNSTISDETIENFNIGEEKTCRYLEFGISYDSDIGKAMKIIQEEAMKHPDFFDNRSSDDKKNKVPAVVVRVLGFGDSSVNLRGWAWARDPGAAFRMGCDLNKIIKERFDREGIEIPFPYRTVVMKQKKRAKGKKK